MSPRNLFWLVFALSLIIKLLVAVYLPINTDEAYFVLWGQHPDYGYYDHPPMVGWWMWLMLQISDATWWIRLPTLIITSLIGWVIYRLLQSRGEWLAFYAAAIYLLLPINLIAVLISTDTPLILWMFLSALAFHFAVQKQSYRLYALAGALLGLAVLSKYFAVLLGFAYLVYILLYARNRAGLLALMLVYLATVPFIFVNLYWNYNHCWTNYLFNFVNRHSGAGGAGGASLLIYWLMWAWLIPPALYYLLKLRTRLKQQYDSPVPVIMVIFVVPFVLFTALSLFKEIGLHWVLGFLPFLLLLLGHLLTQQQLRASLRFIVPYSLLHMLFLFSFLISPTSFISASSPYYKAVILMFHPQQAVAELEQRRADARLATLDYGTAAVMSYYLKENVAVMGYGSHYARMDDMLTDYRSWQGKDVLIFSAQKKLLGKLEGMFASSRYQSFSIEGSDYYLLRGEGFDYEKYRNTFLKYALRYYRIPEALPYGECYYFDKYFPQLK